MMLLVIAYCTFQFCNLHCQCLFTVVCYLGS
uniref:Uncharacterized protein n=1 Tax=Rhizophora mucronata TaxID=61149 RepID=A0A2P2QRR5_RHIMU